MCIRDSFAAVNKQDAAHDAYTAADTNVNTAKGEYEKAKSGTAAAKTAYDAAKDALGGIDIESLKMCIRDRAKDHLQCEAGNGLDGDLAVERCNTVCHGKDRAHKLSLIHI